MASNILEMFGPDCQAFRDTQAVLGMMASIGIMQDRLKEVWKSVEWHLFLGIVRGDVETTVSNYENGFS